MITIENDTIPLDFNLSLDDFFHYLLPHQSNQENLSYTYQKVLSIQEPISIALLPDTLIYYPLLARELRKLDRLEYTAKLELTSLASLHQKGLSSIIAALNAIQNKLQEARLEKARLDARVNNLIYLYGQEKSPPILEDIKFYFYNRTNTYHQSCYKIKVSGVNYYPSYQGNRFGVLKPLLSLSPRALLSHYFEKTKHEKEAISTTAQLDLLGGVINTPIFCFRARYDFRQRGKKYFINLADYKTYTRQAEVIKAASAYTDSFNLKLMKD